MAPEGIPQELNDYLPATAVFLIRKAAGYPTASSQDFLDGSLILFTVAASIAGAVSHPATAAIAATVL